MKSLFTCCALLLVLLLVPVVAYADDPIRLFLDGKQLTPEVPPLLVEGNTLVPVRVIAENLGAKVGWDGNSRKVTLQEDNLNIEMTIDQPKVTVNNSSKMLEVPPKIVDGNTMLPVRFVSEEMGVKVAWDGLTRSVFLFQQENSLTGSLSPQNSNKPQQVDTVDKPASIDNSGNPGNQGTSAQAVSGPQSSAPAGQKPDFANTSGAAVIPAIYPSVDEPSISLAGSQATYPADVHIQPATTNGSSGAAGIPLGDNGAGPSSSAASTGSGKPLPVTKDDPKIPNIQSALVVGDRLYIQSTDSVKANVSYLGNPDRLIIDLPGSELDAKMNGLPAFQNGEISVDSPIVEKIRYALFSDQPSTVRIVLDLKTKTEATPLQTNVPNQLVFQLKGTVPAPASYKVVLDAGHGGHDSGAVSITGRYEKDFTLSMVKKVKALLDQVPGMQVLLSRSDDTFVELDDRVAFANDRNADLFVSIHGNKYTPQTAGTETYYYREESLPLANMMHAYVTQAAGFPDRNVRQEKFRVITKTTMPAVLLEIGYLSNEEEEALMYTEAFQNKVAAAIADGIKDYLHIK